MAGFGLGADLVAPPAGSGSGRGSGGGGSYSSPPSSGMMAPPLVNRGGPALVSRGGGANNAAAPGRTLRDELREVSQHAHIVSASMEQGGGGGYDAFNEAPLQPTVVHVGHDGRALHGDDGGLVGMGVALITTLFCTQPTFQLMQ
jgi:hypothetical protein